MHTNIHPVTGQRMPRYTHYVQYQQKDGTWRDGTLAGTQSECRGVAKAGAERTGRKTRVVAIEADA